jgi:pimeloyl-ACP methyl ester carboxylesterase
MKKSLSININDCTISYSDSGKGIIPVIFIHGFPFDKSSWKPQYEFLQLKYRVIAYDIRGFGKSTSGKERKSINQFADDLVNFMNGLKIDKAIVCGLSMGGYILLNAVIRYPERFTTLILCDTQCNADTPEGREKRKQTIAKINSTGISEFAETFINNIFCRSTLNYNKVLVNSIKNIILSTSTETITETLSALAERSETCSLLHTISIPTLIMCGREDSITPPGLSELLQSKIANSTLHIIENAGHMSNLEQPEKFNKYLDSFLSGFKN